MTHPIVRNIATKIATKRKSDNMLISPIEAVIETVVQEIDVPVYTSGNLKTTKGLTLSDAISRSEKDNSIIMHLPSRNSNVQFMLQAYEFYANKGFLGTQDNPPLNQNGEAPGFPAVDGVPIEWGNAPIQLNMIDNENNVDNPDFFDNDPEDEDN